MKFTRSRAMVSLKRNWILHALWKLSKYRDSLHSRGLYLIFNYVSNGRCDKYDIFCSSYIIEHPTFVMIRYANMGVKVCRPNNVVQKLVTSTRFVLQPHAERIQTTVKIAKRSATWQYWSLSNNIMQWLTTFWKYIKKTSNTITTKKNKKSNSHLNNIKQCWVLFDNIVQYCTTLKNILQNLKIFDNI